MKRKRLSQSKAAKAARRYRKGSSRKSTRKRKRKHTSTTKRRRTSAKLRARLRHEHREAKFAGLSHREYKKRRASRARAAYERRSKMTPDQVVEDLVRTGQLVGVDPTWDKYHYERSRVEVARRAALGDKASQAILRRIP